MTAGLIHADRESLAATDAHRVSAFHAVLAGGRSFDGFTAEQRHSLQPSDLSRLATYAGDLHRAGQSDCALALAQHLLALTAPGDELQNFLTYIVGSASRRLGAPARARRAFERVLDGDGGVHPRYSAGAAYHLAELALGDGQRDDARTLLERCLATLPDHEAARQLLDRLNAAGDESCGDELAHGESWHVPAPAVRIDAELLEARRQARALAVSSRRLAAAVRLASASLVRLELAALTESDGPMPLVTEYDSALRATLDLLTGAQTESESPGSGEPLDVEAEAGPSLQAMLDDIRAAIEAIPDIDRPPRLRPCVRLIARAAGAIADDERSRLTVRAELAEAARRSASIAAGLMPVREPLGSQSLRAPWGAEAPKGQPFVAWPAPAVAASGDHDTPLVTVLTVVEQGGSLLARTRASLRVQTYGRWEHVLVTSHGVLGSTPDLAEVEDARVVLVSAPETSAEEPLLAGLRASRGAYVTLLGEGDTWACSRLARLVEEAVQGKRTVLRGGPLIPRARLVRTAPWTP